MSTSKSFADYIMDQCSDVPGVSVKKMFGEYGLFLSGKMVGILADDNLFIKPTDAGRELLDDVIFAEPYPNAKPYFLIENTENRMLLAELLIRTEKALPMPKPKTKKKVT